MDRGIVLAQTALPIDTALAQLGEVVILAIVILMVVRAITPLIAGLVTATREGAEARKAVIDRWEASDRVVEQNTGALNDVVQSLRAIGDELKHLKDIDVQHVAQGDTTFNEIVSLRADLVKGTDAAIYKVNQHMDARTSPIDHRLEIIERDVREILTLLRARHGQPTPDGAAPPADATPVVEYAETPPARPAGTRTTNRKRS